MDFRLEYQYQATPLSRWEGSVEVDISSSIDEHHFLEALKVVDKISYPIIAFQLESLEASGEWCLHNLVVERWVFIEFVILCWLVTNCFNPLVRLLNFLLNFRVPDGKNL